MKRGDLVKHLWWHPDDDEDCLSKHFAQEGLGIVIMVFELETRHYKHVSYEPRAKVYWFKEECVTHPRPRVLKLVSESPLT